MSKADRETPPTDREARTRQDLLRDDPPRHRGRGSQMLYSRYSASQAVVELLTAYKWPLTLFTVVSGLVVGGLAWTGNLPTVTVPVEMWAALYYSAVGSLAAIPAGWYLVRRFDTVSGVECLDLDPVSNDHRHLRVGTDVWDDLVVKSPWGSTVGTESLQEITVNGRSGYEIMDLRVPEDGPPTAVATWMGEADSATLRTYKAAVTVARKRLSRQAERATVMEANRHTLVREAAERVVTQMIRTAERSGLPHGDEIEATVSDVLSEYGLDDPLADDDLEHSAEGVERSPPGADHEGDLPDDQLGESQADPQTNGHGGRI